MNAVDYDVAVVGGGPAGCSAAIRLAVAGARVAVLEAGTYPRDKVCGEFLSPECRVLLAQLGLSSALVALGAVHIDLVSIKAPGGAEWGVRFPHPAWGLSRRALDAALADRAAGAGAEVQSETRVEDIAGDLRQGFTLSVRSRGAEHVIRSRSVIAAYGRRARLDRTLDRQFFKRRSPYVALKGHFQGPPLPGRLELNLFPGGYCGLSETEDGSANFGLLVREGVFGAVAGPGLRAIDGFMAWLRRQNAQLDAWFSEASGPHGGWLSIAQVPFLAKEAVLRDILFAGDAAGVIAPLAGDGIAMALRSGGLAADLLSQYLRAELSGQALARTYASAWAREFSPRLRLGRALQPLLMEPHVAGPGLRLIPHLPLLGNALLRGTRDLRALDEADAAITETNP